MQSCIATSEGLKNMFSPRRHTDTIHVKPLFVIFRYCRYPKFNFDFLGGDFPLNFEYPSILKFLGPILIYDAFSL